MVEFKSILCPIDLSEASVRPVAYAAAFAKRHQTRLQALIAERPRTTCAVTDVVVAGRAYRQILETAIAQEADLIVMGAQGRGGVGLTLFGSNTQQIVRAATCPVLTIRG